MCCAQRRWLLRMARAISGGGVGWRVKSRCLRCGRDDGGRVMQMQIQMRKSERVIAGEVLGEAVRMRAMTGGDGDGGVVVGGDAQRTGSK